MYLRTVFDEGMPFPDPEIVWWLIPIEVNSYDKILEWTFYVSMHDYDTLTRGS